MNLDFLGAEQNFTVLAGSQPTYRLDFIDDSGLPLDLDNVTFDGVLTAPDGTERPLDITQAESGNTLLIVFPTVDTGMYLYELRATSEGGDRLRLAYGRLGVMGTNLELARVEDDTEVRRLAVRVPGNAAAHCMLEWRAVTDAQRAAQDAADSAREAADALKEMEQVRQDAKEAVKQAQDALGKLNALDAKLAEVEGHITSAIVPNPETNTWWICGSNTGYQVTGDPGKSPKLSSTGTWMIWNVETQAWDDTEISAAGEDGHSPYVNAAGHWCTWNVLTGEYEDTGLAAAGRDGIDGAKVRRIVVGSVAEIPTSGETCNGGFYYYVPVSVEVPPAEEGAELGVKSYYEVYAWLEQPDGTAAWVCIGEANDIATAEIYGLVRLGTDHPVTDGAPVGNDAAGQMAVPHADFTTPGAVLPALEGVLADGGAVGFDASGRMRAEPASFNKFGVIKPSINQTLDNACIGLRADGRASVRWATLQDAGVVRLGSVFNQLNPIPYQHGVGSTPNHQLANNLLYGGALQHQRPSYWSGKGMDWLAAAMNEHPKYFASTDYFMGIVTSNQFTQSQASGLELESASASLMAGVYLASTLGNPIEGTAADARGNAVPTAAQTADYLSQFYYNKSEVFTKEETRGHVAEELKPYATQSWVEGKGYDTAESVNGKLTGYIPKSPRVERIEVLTREEYNNLTVRDAKTLYIMAASVAS